MQESRKYERASFTYNGKRYYAKGRTKEEAIRKATLKEDALKRGEIALSEKTVAQYWDEYLDTYHANANSYTRQGYKTFYKTGIEPYIGSIMIAKIKQSDVQRLYNSMKGKSYSYVSGVKILVNGLFEAAIGDGIISKNPAKGAKLPKSEKGSRRALTDEERKLFLKVTPDLEKIGLFYLVVYYCGLRPSEVARIQGVDIDRKKRILHVRGTKTSAATRDVPIPLALQFPPCDGYLFLTKQGVPPGKSARTKWFWKIRDAMEKASGAPVADDLTGYCLRHDYCTRLQEAGVPIDVARRLMGHSSIEMTSRIYTHANSQSIDLAQNLIDAYNDKM